MTAFWNAAPYLFQRPEHRKGNAAANKDETALGKKVGTATYNVSDHFCTTSTETMSGKIKRMLRIEIQQM